MLDELYFKILVMSDDLEMCCDGSASFAFRFSKRSWGRNARRTPKNVCVGCYRFVRNLLCGAFRIQLPGEEGCKMSAARAQVCKSNVDQSPTWNKDFYLLPLTYQPFVSNRVLVAVFFFANLNLNTCPAVTAITVGWKKFEQPLKLWVKFITKTTN